MQSSSLHWNSSREESNREQVTVLFIVFHVSDDRECNTDMGRGDCLIELMRPPYHHSVGPLQVSISLGLSGLCKYFLWSDKTEPADQHVVGGKID